MGEPGWADPERSRRRLRARRIALAVAMLCVLAALALGALELRGEGLNQFMFRAPGVGASTPAPGTGGN